MRAEITGWVFINEILLKKSEFDSKIWYDYVLGEELQEKVNKFWTNFFKNIFLLSQPQTENSIFNHKDLKKIIEHAKILPNDYNLD